MDAPPADRITRLGSALLLVVRPRVGDRRRGLDREQCQHVLVHLGEPACLVGQEEAADRRPDPFRLMHRTAIRDLVGDVIRQGMDKRAANTHIGAWAAEHIEDAARKRFREIVERELLSLHEGNFSRYRIRRSEFAAWKTNWSG